MTEWEPATEAEVAMRDALRANDQELYFRLLSRTDLLLPVSAPALPGQASPGWGTWTTGGRTHVLAFTSSNALRTCLGDHAGTNRRVPFSDLAVGWPNNEWWLAVNPGLPVEGYLPAWFVAQLSRGDVRLPGRAMGARARLERAESLARTRSGTTGRDVASSSPTTSGADPAATPPTRPSPSRGAVPPTSGSAVPEATSRTSGPAELSRRPGGEDMPAAGQRYPTGPPRSGRPGTDSTRVTGRPASRYAPLSAADRPGAVPPERPGPAAVPAERPGPAAAWPPANRPAADVDGPAATNGGGQGGRRSFFEPASAPPPGGARPGDRAVPPSRLGRGSQPFPRRRPADAPASESAPRQFPDPDATRPIRPPAVDLGASRRVRPPASGDETTQPLPPRRTEPLGDEPTRAFRVTGPATAEPPLTRVGWTDPGAEQTQAIPRGWPGTPSPFEPVEELPASVAEPVSGPPAPRRGFTPIVIEGTIIESRDLTDPAEAGGPVDAAWRPGPEPTAPPSFGSARSDPAPSSSPMFGSTSFNPAPSGPSPFEAAPSDPVRSGSSSFEAAPSDPMPSGPNPFEPASPRPNPFEPAPPRPNPFEPAPPRPNPFEPVSPGSVSSDLAGGDRGGVRASDLVGGDRAGTGLGSPVGLTGADRVDMDAPVGVVAGGQPAGPGAGAGTEPRWADADDSVQPTVADDGGPHGMTGGPVPVEFQPANTVEEDLLAAAGAGSTDTFLSTLLLARVLLPAAAESARGSRPGDPGFVWRTEQLDNETYVVVYTSPERLADHVDGDVDTVRVKFAQLIRRWPDEDWSFAVNPGTPVGAKLPGEQIVALANWAAEVGLGDDLEVDPEEPTVAAEPAARPRYAPAAVDPARPTVMQKAIAPSQLAYYLDRGYDRVSGFVHRAGELAHLTTPAQLHDALGLGYPDSPFERDAEEIYVLRWPAHRPSLYRIPYGGQNEPAMRAMEGWVIERPPFRGNGFAPGESSDVVAEFKVDSARLPYGAQLWRIGADGAERVIAVLDTDTVSWRRAGEA
ncbi:SseB family protein [Micromonospora vulcania]|uniref:SseB family protein n=1 Tax=Micromonospora vulcania TaxID=1441873 RepID=A0ABW1HCI3_9ACTN